MSESHSANRVDELGDIFVSVTGEDEVTESQEEAETGDREVADETVEVEDGLEDAVDGAEVGVTEDPVE